MLKNKYKKAEAYIDTVVTVFISMLIIFLAVNVFSYYVTYQKLNNIGNNILRCIAINGNTDSEEVQNKIKEYITGEGLKVEDISVSFDGSDYVTNSTVQYGDTMALHISTSKKYSYIGKPNNSPFTLRINKITLSEKYYNENKKLDYSSDGLEAVRPSGTKVPDGATYKLADGTLLVYFPEEPLTGDIYEEDDYIYGYNSYWNNKWELDSTQNGWGVRVKNTAKTTYDKIISEIAGKSVTTLRQTFQDCTSLTVAPTIPNSVTTMSGTFYYCTSLTTAPTIPNGVTNMWSTFNHCNNLTSAPTIPSSVTNMQYTFNYCGNLTTAPTIPNNVKIMYGTFQNCISLTTAPTIPNSVTNMRYTFNGCTSLISAPVIPNSVTNMLGTFNGCTSLAGTIEVNANPTSYTNCLKSTQITGITGSCSQATKDALMATK